MASLQTASVGAGAPCTSGSSWGAQRRTTHTNGTPDKCRPRRERRQLWAACSRRSGEHPPPLPPPQAVDRRGLLALLAAANVAALPAPAANAAPGGVPVQTPGAAPAPLQPLPVPPLTETFMSPEGFRFDYPQGWVVAFDRTGSTGNGAVIVVGDFRALITVSVFRTETVPAAVKAVGLNEETGYSIIVQPQQQDASTLRFQLVRSGMAAPLPPLPGADPAAPPPLPAYDYEYSIESCVGEIEEGMGGRLRCLGPFGNLIPTNRRRHIGRCVLLPNGIAYSLNASSPEDRWVQVGPILQAVVNTFRA